MPSRASRTGTFDLVGSKKLDSHHNKTNKGSYKNESFVDVMADKEIFTVPICIGEILSRKSDNDENLCTRTVHWYETRRKLECMTGCYQPSFRDGTNKKMCETSWNDQISTDAVMISFWSQKWKGKLSVGVQKPLRRESLGVT